MRSAAQAIGSQEETEDLVTRRVLIVDDDPDICEALRDAVEAEGFAAEIAHNGREALDVLERRPLPSLILLDMMMPEMDGWQFRRTQLNTPKIARVPVAVITAGYTAPWDVDEVLLKPISRDKLRRALRIAGP